MPPPKSKVWLYFDRNVNGAECKLCKKNVVSKGGNTTNLAVHLRRTHKIECSPHPSVAGLFKKATPDPDPTALTKSTSSVPEPENSEDTMQSDLPQLPQLPQFPDIATNPTQSQVSILPSKAVTSIWERARMGKLDVAKQHKITRKIAAYLVKDMRPFSTVESQRFRDMIHAVDERVVIPNKDTFSQRIIPSWYNLEVSKLMEELKTTEHVALTSDCWTSRTTIPYLTVTAHFIDGNYDLKSKVLHTKVLDDRHTGENISVALNNVLESWQIGEKVTVMTTDNASNMGLAIQISDISLKIGCFAHTLDLAAKKAVSLAKPISRKMKPVISFLHRSHVGAKVLKEKQEALNVPKHKLITDVETRWNSTYLMFQRYFEQRVAIHATFLDKRLESQRTIYRDFKDIEVLKAEEFIDTMKDFYEMTLAVCSESNPTASLVLPLCEKALRKCEPQDDDSEFSKELKKAIRDNLCTRYQDPNVRDFLLKATALDPKTKSRGLVQESTWSKLSEEVVQLLEKEKLLFTEPSVLHEVHVKVEEGEETAAVKEEGPAEKKHKTSLIDSILCDDDDDDVTITAAYQRTPNDIATDEIRSYRDAQSHKCSPFLENLQKQTTQPCKTCSKISCGSGNISSS